MKALYPILVSDPGAGNDATQHMKCMRHCRRLLSQTHAWSDAELYAALDVTRNISSGRSIIREGHATVQAHRKDRAEPNNIKLDFWLRHRLPASWCATKTPLSLHNGNAASASTAGAGAD
jgi:hypothetical protein